MSASWAVGAVPWEGSFLDWLDAPKAAHWLDVGCGNGAFTEEILTRTQPAKVTGIDPSGGQIKFAHSREGTKAADCHVGDAQALPFAKATFDASIMALAIAFVPDPAKGVSELVRVTKEGGLVATYMWELPGSVPLYPFANALRDMGKPMVMPISSQFSHMDALTKLWQSAGLTAVQSRQIHTTISYTSFEDMWESSLLTGPLKEQVSQLSSEVQADLANRVRASLPPAADGSIHFECFANAVKGVRRA